MSSIRKPEIVSVSLFTLLSNSHSEYSPPQRSPTKAKESKTKVYTNRNNDLIKEKNNNTNSKESSVFRKNLELIGNMTMFNPTANAKEQRSASKTQNKGRERDARSKHEERMKKARLPKEQPHNKLNSLRDTSFNSK